MASESTGRTIGGLGIGSERGNKCCTCCGGCYSGCCPCKPVGDLRLTVTQWYVEYKKEDTNSVGGTFTSSVWMPIDPPCDVEIILKKRDYECLGSGAIEDNRNVYNDCFEEFIWIDGERHINPAYIEELDMGAVDFYKKYGYNMAWSPNCGPAWQTSDPDYCTLPLTDDYARMLAYADTRYRNTACSEIPPFESQWPEGMGPKAIQQPHDPTHLHDKGNNQSTVSKPTTNTRENFVKEAWGFTGRICSKEEHGCESKNYEPRTDAAGTTDGQPLKEDGSNGLPDWEFLTNDCGGMCISISLCCCNMDSQTHNDPSLDRSCALDSRRMTNIDGSQAYMHPDIDPLHGPAGAPIPSVKYDPVEGFSVVEQYEDETVENCGQYNEKDGRLEGVSSPFDLSKPGVELGRQWDRLWEGPGYTFDTHVDEYQCGSECYKLQFSPYDCYTFSGYHDGEFRYQDAIEKPLYLVEGDAPMMGGGTANDVLGVHPGSLNQNFTQRTIIDGAVVSQPGGWPQTNTCADEGGPGDDWVKRGISELRHKFNTPCSPCTFVHKGIMRPGEPGWWDGPESLIRKEWEEAQPYGAGEDGDAVIFSWAQGLPGIIPSVKFGCQGLGAVSPDWYQSLSPPYSIPMQNGDIWMDWLQNLKTRQGRCFFRPNRPTQCKCPREENEEGEEEGCRVDRKFMIKYAVPFYSSCDCTIGVNATGVIPLGNPLDPLWPETAPANEPNINAPIERLGLTNLTWPKVIDGKFGPNGLDDAKGIWPKYAISRPWLGATVPAVSTNPADNEFIPLDDPPVKSNDPGGGQETGPGLGQRVSQVEAGQFRWDILITEVEE